MKKKVKKKQLPRKLDKLKVTLRKYLTHPLFHALHQVVVNSCSIWEFLNRTTQFSKLSFCLQLLNQLPLSLLTQRFAVAFAVVGLILSFELHIVILSRSWNYYPLKVVILPRQK